MMRRVIVTNHGGRQIEGVTASLRALLEVVAALNGRGKSNDGGKNSLWG